MATPTATSRLGSALVIAQFSTLGLLTSGAAPALRRGLAPWGTWPLLLLSALLAGWALYVNRPGNFNIRPTPRTGGKLVRVGPYRWIRHPMYTSVMAMGAGCALAQSNWPAAAMLAVLVGVLVVKAALEERWMTCAHPAYAVYRLTTWRFVPWVV